MKLNLIDPNNHPPEVKDGDGWDDVEGFEEPKAASINVLPRKRLQTEPSQLEESKMLKAEYFEWKNSSPASEITVQEISGEVVKLLPPEPSPEKVVPHLVFHPRPTAGTPTEYQDNQDNERKSIKSIPLVWLLGSGVTITCLVVTALAIVPIINRANAQKSRSPTRILVPEKLEGSQDSTNIGDMLNSQTEAKQMFERYATAKTGANILPIILDPATNGALVHSHFQPINAQASWRVSDHATWTTTHVGLKIDGQLRGVLPDFSPFIAYFTLVNRQLKLDWKATTGFSTATFAELAKGKGDPSEIRGILAPTSFFTQFWPEKIYQSYRLVSEKENDTIWCYAKNDSGIAKQIYQQFAARGGKQGLPIEIRVTLRLEPGPNDVLSNQWLIAELIHTDWNQP